jgi:GT2 family glycosyltransferase
MTAASSNDDAHVPGIAERAGAIVVNYNGGAVLTRAIDCIAAQTRAFDRVVVVDNASVDGSSTNLDPAVEVIAFQENVGFAAANNRGIELLNDCNWVALVNPDAFLAANWLEIMLAAARDTGAASIGCVLVDEGDQCRLDGVADVYHLSGLAWRHLHGAPRSMAPRQRCEIFGPCAAAALYSRSALVEAGGFERRYFCYFEDVDLAFRLRSLGYKSVCEPAAVALHMGSAITGEGSAFTAYHISRNLVWTFVRNAPRPLLRYLPQHLVANLVTIAILSRAGHTRTVLRAKRDALRGLPWVLQSRREILARRRVNRRALQCHLLSGWRDYRSAQRDKRGWE